ncbi:ABC transporter transmembrane domain-containing protein [Phenylobacterium immobile]|uniref:ABC transporter transmembrane domain-containing protein n=1 Tax=Phenylobacterium immobile TaxID=21 RepID=UPI000B1F9BF1|nr:ABC transporter transmembrane domain-containing protein [Phenylobacterium immobile]
MAATEDFGIRALGGWIRQVLAPDAAYVRLAVVYGLAISLLSLATPISVQLLINSVASLALPAPLFTLSAVLFLLLVVAGLLSAARAHLMALFERRVFARIVAEITLRAVHAQNPFFGDTQKGDLFNRFFDLMAVQKAMPSLLIGAFTILLQGIVGLTVTSFYHPFFIAFNVTLVLVLFLVWRLWADGAVRTAVEVSHAKHAAAHWLESVGGSNGFYQSGRHLDFAMDRSEAVTKAYVTAHDRHFRYSFSQTVALLLIYAMASAALLTLGGWLIIQEELSIGQLVAAELILSGVFYGIAQLGGYLDVFYEFAASLEELSLFWAIPQENNRSRAAVGPANGEIRMQGVEIGDHRFDFTVASGEQLVVVAEPGVDRTLALLLKRHSAPEHGMAIIGGADIGAFDMYRLRSDVFVIDRPTIVEMTIREYLTLAAPGSSERILQALDCVGLTARIGRLPKGLDTQLSSSGWPLALDEMIALKLAAGVLVAPRVLMLSSLFDLLPAQRIAPALALLRAAGTTVLRFTSHPRALSLEGWLWMGAREQHRCDGPDDLVALQSDQGTAHALSA